MGASMNPPEGSRLSVQWIDGQQTIVAPPQPRGAAAVFLTLFLLVWLALWTFGGLQVVRHLVSGRTGDGEVFLAFWLIGWALGEAFALSMLYRNVRPAIPERFTLRLDGLAYDSGVAPPRIYGGSQFGRSRRDLWPKRIRRIFPSDDLKTLRLREGGDANRLTVDVGAERVDLAKNCTEVEREWLFRTLSDHYRLADDWRRS